MKDRPILFSVPMIRAILNGSKTQTRRVVTARSKYWKSIDLHTDISEWYYANSDLWQSVPSVSNGLMNEGLRCPYGSKGDRLWVRETWRLANTECLRYEYRADVEIEKLKWMPSILMPRAASRITLEITDIRIERLQSITEESAISEGIELIEQGPIKGWKDYRFGGVRSDVIGSYRSLWDFINSKTYPWDSNPWIWIVQFSKVS